MNKLLALFSLLSVFAATPALAKNQTATLNVSGMTCSVCPITVKKALSQVSGVSRVEVDLEKQQALVTYDDAKTGVDKLVRATTDAGYPSTVKQAQ